MAELNAVFREMIDTLTQAQLPVQEELTQLARSETPEPERLRRLAKSVGDFLAQAEGLITMILDRGAEDGLLDRADTLLGLYEDAKGAGGCSSKGEAGVRLGKERH
jgi:hypothetical protein